MAVLPGHSLRFNLRLGYPNTCWAGTVRKYITARLDKEGDLVEVSSAPGGIVCFKLNFRGERIDLWFNAWTSTAIVIGSDGKVRKPLFAEDPAK